MGSDSRDGLSEQTRKDLHAGAGGGGRTDSMMLLHAGAHGTTMVSLPRDSWVTLPSYLDPDTGIRHRPAKNELKAAYSLGGAQLLVRTVELNTGIRIDHYAEIGFGGFVGVVNAVGGVDMCVDRNIKDEKSGLDLTQGCHTLDDAQALAFVRQRHQEAQGDMGRSRNQQKFLAALAHKAGHTGHRAQPVPGLSPAGLGAGHPRGGQGHATAHPRLAVPGDAKRLVRRRQTAQRPRDGPRNQHAEGRRGAVGAAKAKKLFGELQEDRLTQ